MELVKVTQDGNFFTMTVKRESGDKEKWLYEREETSAGVSYIQIGRE